MIAPCSREPPSHSPSTPCSARRRHASRRVGALPACCRPVSRPRPCARRDPRHFAGRIRRGNPRAHRGSIDRPRHRDEIGPAHRRQPGIHRAGAVQHLRQLFLRVRVERLVQPQRRQLRSGRTHAARRRIFRAHPDRASRCLRRTRRLPAARGDGGRPVPGRPGTARPPPHPTIIRTSRRETVVLLITFVAAIFANLEFAIYAGVLLSLMLYLVRTSHPLCST